MIHHILCPVTSSPSCLPLPSDGHRYRVLRDVVTWRCRVSCTHTAIKLESLNARCSRCCCVTSLSLPVHAVQQRLPLPGSHWNTHLCQPHTASNLWLWRLLNSKTPPATELGRRLPGRFAWNHAPHSTSLTCGPALQFGIAEGYLFGPHWFGLMPLQLIMFLTFLFLTRGIFTTGVLKIK